jgi:ribonuclease VapC
MIVDSSAVVAILFAEADARTFSEALEHAENLRLSAGTYVELGVVIDGRRNPLLSRKLDEILETAKIVIEPVTERQARIAREAYRDYGKGSGHAANLNFGDCFAYALAHEKGEALLFKGTDFGHTDIRSVLP